MSAVRTASREYEYNLEGDNKTFEEQVKGYLEIFLTKLEKDN